MKSIKQLWTWILEKLGIVDKRLTELEEWQKNHEHEQKPPLPAPIPPIEEPEELEEEDDKPLPEPEKPEESAPKPIDPVVEEPVIDPKPRPDNPNPVDTGISLNLVRVNRNLESAGKGDPYFKRVTNRAVNVGKDAMSRPLQHIYRKNYDPSNIDPNFFKNFNPQNILTFAPYWHKGKNGVWYRIDGKGNGLSAKVGDTVKIQAVCATVQDLAFAYIAASGEQKEQFAKRLVDNVQVFFLDKTTGMLPNLDYAQLIPGNKDIRVEAMVEAPFLVKVCDAIILIKDSKYYTPEFERGIKQWFADFLKWMTTSRLGLEAEKRILGNIGVIYELMLASFAAFTDNEEFLSKRYEKVKARLWREMAPNGSFPEELKRHKANMYSNKALQAWVQVAKVYNIRGFNLWLEEKDGKSLKKAGLFLVPYMMGEKSLARGEKVNVNYALDTFRTLQFVYKNDLEAVKEFGRFLKKYDGAFRNGNDTGALVEPFMPW